MIEAQLLSKVLDEKDFHILRRYNVTAAEFPTLGPVYGFIRDYVREHKTTPDYRTVVAEFENFEYVPGLADDFKYLSGKIKAQHAKRQAFELLQHQATRKFAELPGDKFVEWLREEAQKIEQTTCLGDMEGTDYATNGEERAGWYEDAKRNRTRQFIPTPYPSLTNGLGGGMELGDYILLMAFTNRGKSWLASDMGLAAWKKGFDVLHYSPELSKRQQALRLDTLAGHFDNVKLRRGTLENEPDYMVFLQDFTGDAETRYIIKTMEDLPNGLTLEAIEADLQTHKETKLIIIDGFNLMSHGKGKMRDGMTQTSRRLRQIFGRYNMAGLVVHQTPGAAEKEKNKEDNGTRIVKPPKLTDYSETIAVIQDAATALTFDQAEGVGRLSIEKAREPNVGLVVELRCDFNRGFIKETQLTDIF